ncbi:hypothetical protein GmHk_18G051748 [Glycine max]|nr:hypothetical protein GmHk_18G051748 [Glycine max]
MARKPRQDFGISKGQIFLFMWLSMSHIKRKIVMAAQLIHDRVEMECLEGAWETLEGNTRCRFRGTIRFTATSLVHPDEPARTLQRTVEWILPTPTPYRLVEPVQVIEVTSSEEDPEEDPEELPPEPAVDALDLLEGDEDPLPEVDSPEDVMSASEADSTEDSGPGEMIVMAAQLIHDRVEMECLEGARETLEGNTRCRFRGTIRFTATSLVHPDEPARTLQRTVEWILPTPTPYRLVEPVQVIEVTSSEEDPEEDPEELPLEPAVDALDLLEGDEDPLPEVDSLEDVMSASEADSTEDSGPGEMAISGGSSS